MFNNSTTDVSALLRSSLRSSDSNLFRSSQPLISPLGGGAPLNRAPVGSLNMSNRASLERSPISRLHGYSQHGTPALDIDTSLSSFALMPPAHDPAMAGIEKIPAVARLRASVPRTRLSAFGGAGASCGSATASIGSPRSRADSDVNSVTSDGFLLDDSLAGHVTHAGADERGSNSSNSSSSNNPLFKTNLCREFSLSGTCPFGRRCHFAHGDHELRPVPPEFETSGAQRSGSSALSDQVFKTELCHVFMQLGACRYGVRCHFAHGFDELRPRWSAKKTPRVGKCIQFESTGKCRFGSRCRFLHGDKVPSECESGNADASFNRRSIPAADLGAFMAPQLAAFSSGQE